jgi:uncharacterized C2H2 Zn-finger protein
LWSLCGYKTGYLPLPLRFECCFFDCLLRFHCRKKGFEVLSFKLKFFEKLDLVLSVVFIMDPLPLNDELEDECIIPGCGQIFSLRHAYISHLRSHLANELTCTSCRCLFTSSEDLEDHIVHSNCRSDSRKRRKLTRTRDLTSGLKWFPNSLRFDSSRWSDDFLHRSDRCRYGRSLWSL